MYVTPPLAPIRISPSIPVAVALDGILFVLTIKFPSCVKIERLLGFDASPDPPSLPISPRLKDQNPATPDVKCPRPPTPPETKQYMFPWFTCKLPVVIVDPVAAVTVLALTDVNTPVAGVVAPTVPL